MRSPTDHAIKKAEEDRLNRRFFAADVAKYIRFVDTSEGYVLGLLGPWGSGKSSLANLIIEQLQQDPPISVVEFNPWLFSGTESLVDSFFSELSAQLRLKDPARYSKLADQIDRYSNLLTPLTWIPVVGPWAGRLKSLTGIAKSVQDRRKESVQAQKQRLADTLSRLKSPVVVLIDDIDRLGQREVQDIFRLVRLTANFPNIVYMLTFDRARVESALEEDGMSGRSYLEKIIQAVWDVPVAPRHMLLNQLSETLDESLEEIGEFYYFDVSRWPDTLAEIIFPLIRNMRDVKRFAASALVTVVAVQDQVDLGDILALEAIRVFLPDVFAAIATFRDSLTTPSPNFHPQNEPPSLRLGIEELLRISGDHEPVVQNLLRRLFPASVRHFENRSFGAFSPNDWLKGRRVAHQDILAHYLERTVPDGLSAFNDAERAVAKMANPGGFSAFLEELEVERLTEVISALEVFEGSYPVDGVPEAVTKLINIIPSLPNSGPGLISLNPGIGVGRIALRMLSQYADQDKVGEVLKSAFRDSPSLSAKYTIVDLAGQWDTSRQPLVKEKKVEDLRADFLQLLYAAKESELASEHDLESLLLAPKQFAGAPVLKVSEAAGELTHLAVFQALSSEIRSQSMGDRAVQRTPTLSWDLLTEVYGSEDSIRRVVTRLRSAKLENSQEIVDLAERYLSGWRPRR